MSESVSKTWQNNFSPSIVLKFVATVFALRQPISCVFLQRSEILYWENKSDKEFRELKQELKQIVIRVGQRTRYRNFAYCRLCCLSIFPAKLLICCQTFSLKRL